MLGKVLEFGAGRGAGGVSGWKSHICGMGQVRVSWLGREVLS
jgi:hypothetical protein